jgi:ABC-type Na+ efflux pump permease subunit
MLKKEILDSIKTLLLCMLLLLCVPLGYVMDKFVIHFGWSLKEIFNFIYLLTTIAFPIAAGLTIFQSEKKDRAFEYLFSLPLSRFQIIMCKILPRLMLLLILITASTLFSVYANIWINGFNLVILFLVSIVMSISFNSLAIGIIGVSVFFYVYYHFSRTIHTIFIGMKPELMDPFSLTAFFYNLLSAVLLLIPLGIAFWITFKRMDVKPLKLQMKSYYMIVLPTLLILIAFIIITFKTYLSLTE